MAESSQIANQAAEIMKVRRPRRRPPLAGVRVSDGPEGTVVAVADFGMPIGELLAELATRTRPGDVLADALVDRKHRRLSLVVTRPQP